MVVAVNGGWGIVEMVEIARDTCRLCHPHVTFSQQSPAYFGHSSKKKKKKNVAPTAFCPKILA